jgi:hypothetical protein
VGQLAHDVLAKQPTVTKLVQRMAATVCLNCWPTRPTSAAPWWPSPQKAGASPPR